VAGRRRGTPDAAHPGGGERLLEAGEIVGFPEGEEGAHAVGNAGDETVRVAIFSTRGRGHVIYPDSGKVGAGGRYFRLADAVDYWDGE
jgi:uncharacterized cupin superfamily protein